MLYVFAWKAHERISEQVRGRPMSEVGGLLLVEEDRENRIAEAWPMRNAADDPTKEFRLDPRQLGESLRDAGAAGLYLAGTYHSHPNGRADLSREDVRLAESTGLLLVVPVRPGLLMAPRLYSPEARGSIPFAFQPQEKAARST